MKHALNWFIVFLVSAAIAGCSSTPPKKPTAETTTETPTEATTPKPASYTETGQAAFYADEHHSEKTASGERYNPAVKTAAHRTLPFGTKIKVTNLNNGKSVVAEVTDRGPFTKSRIIDLSKSAFSSIASTSSGIITVQIEVIE